MNHSYVFRDIKDILKQSAVETDVPSWSASRACGQRIEPRSGVGGKGAGKRVRKFSMGIF